MTGNGAASEAAKSADRRRFRQPLATPRFLKEDLGSLMADLVLANFPPSLLARLDRYIGVLEELNPGHKWTRSACVATLLSRALAELEGAEVRHRRSRDAAPSAEPVEPERRTGPAERREGGDRRAAASYPEMVDLVIEHLLREKKRLEDETWRDRHD